MLIWSWIGGACRAPCFTCGRQVFRYSGLWGNLVDLEIYSIRCCCYSFLVPGGRCVSLILALIFLCGCSFSERKLEKAFADASIASEKEPVLLDLSVAVGKKVERACVQRQYMTKKAFESLVGADAPGFVDISEDGDFVVWLYYTNGRRSQIKLSRALVVPPDRVCSGSAVISISRSKIYFN